ncbi:hypothetical protein OIU76_019205 [Salix suchowensis]|nr:hypothetical protein OIU76_019205 [Salix suchowensis]
MRRKLKSAGKMVSMRERDVIDSTDKDLELPVFDLATIAIATSNFSEANKLGEGGFGPVYKVKLRMIRELSVSSFYQSLRC